MRKTILLVEDDREISELIRQHLRQEGFAVLAAYDGEEAMAMFERERIDLMVLDLMLPQLGGLEVLRKVRERSRLPVLILSAKGSELDKALGLGIGADDYISKPFSMIELTARIHAAIRRVTEYLPPKEETTGTVNVLQYKDLTLDLNTFAAFAAGKTILLTSKEFHILKLFMTHPNRVFTKEQIYHFVWEDDYYGNENVINVHIRRLREKIESDPSNPTYLRTIWGIGYKLGE